jgi:hypothetical protein
MQVAPKPLQVTIESCLPDPNVPGGMVLLGLSSALKTRDLIAQLHARPFTVRVGG